MSKLINATSPVPTEVRLEFQEGELCEAVCEDERRALQLLEAVKAFGRKGGKSYVVPPKPPAQQQQVLPRARKRGNDELEDTGGNHLPKATTKPLDKWNDNVDDSSKSQSGNSSSFAGGPPLSSSHLDETPQPGGGAGNDEAAARRARIDANSGTRHDQFTPEKRRDTRSFNHSYQRPTRSIVPQSSALQLTRKSSFTVQSSAAYQGYRANYSFGLQNLGNTCYLNAVMQALCSLREFATNLWAMPDSIPQVAQGRLFSGSSEVLRKMNCASSGPLSPGKLRALIAQASPMFASNQQQDAHEFLLEYVNQLHDELLHARKSWLDAKSLSDEEDRGILSTQLFWDSEVQKTLTCVNCHESRDVFERFRDFSLDFPAGAGGRDEKCELQSMLQSYFAKELLELKCNHCSAVAAHMWKRLTQEPKVLVLHLKRFVPNMEKQMYEKQHQSVEIPSRLDIKASLKDAFAGSSISEKLSRPPASPMASASSRCPAVWEVDLGGSAWQPFEPHEARQLEEHYVNSPNDPFDIEARGQKYAVDFVKWQQVNKETNMSRSIQRRLPDSHVADVPSGPMYDLRSVIAHDGASPHSGHYVCYAKSEKGSWRLYDDSMVKDLPSQDISRIVGRKAYILFYVLQQ